MSAWSIARWFDEWLRDRAAAAGAERRAGTFERIDRDSEGAAVLRYRPLGGDAPSVSVKARMIVGADGARSKVARSQIPSARDRAARDRLSRDRPHASASAPARAATSSMTAPISPDFYGWVFPHGPVTSVGMGTAVKGVVAARRHRLAAPSASGLADDRDHPQGGRADPSEAAPALGQTGAMWCWLATRPAWWLRPRARAIYYAMIGGQLAAEAVTEACLADRRRRARSRQARRRFMKAHGRVFWIPRR